MRRELHRRGLRVALAIAFVAGCKTGAERPAQAPGPDPMTTVRSLLSLHDLLGKQPEERGASARSKPPDPAELNRLFADYDRLDPFLGNLYVGFVTGALARNQGRLFVSRQGDRAEVSAGRLRVIMKRSEGRYRIVLEKTVPYEIKARAAREKAIFDQAAKGRPPRAM